MSLDIDIQELIIMIIMLVVIIAIPSFITLVLFAASYILQTLNNTRAIGLTPGNSPIPSDSTNQSQNYTIVSGSS